MNGSSEKKSKKESRRMKMAEFPAAVGLAFFSRPRIRSLVVFCLVAPSPLYLTALLPSCSGFVHPGPPYASSFRSAPIIFRHVVLEGSLSEPASCPPQDRGKHRSIPVQAIPHFFFSGPVVPLSRLQQTFDQRAENPSEPMVRSRCLGSPQLLRYGRCSAWPYHAAKAGRGVSHPQHWRHALYANSNACAGSM